MVKIDKKIISAGILLLIIGGLGLYVGLNYNTIFNQEINLTFPDGCIERYQNGDLITPICENGREIRDQQIKELDPEKWKQIHNIT